MTIQYYQKSSYGVTRNYLKDPKLANLFNNLTNRMTMTTYDMEILTKFGCQFEEVDK